ncbi:uncharacterized protein FIBRA_06363 [Fibroporia radiculosa]|uniref:RRM domain-containing protein n=1 Tax=Fibroporia radiculosa TaxID=599839 RepID=J4HYZ7_9APHY|nr:uncharacterized protein FIBRA_06363 [Fibroporia radiculosa]CCM04197.1 predicted protein [Fibroporia radiculosa]
MAKAPKLTKKQKKALAFRERKAKNKVKALDGFEDNDIPVEENQDAVEAEVPSGHVEDQARRQELEASAGEEDNRVVESSHSLKKRKRREEEAGKGVEDEPKAKKRKAADSNEHEDPSISRSSIPKAVAESNVKEKRFILFIGNLKYTTTQKAIQIHFAACDPPPTVRLITPKAPSSGKPVTKSKGCAFLEFSSRNALQQALKLHQSELEGRMINVELTAGGGGKSESRLEKLKQRNKELHEQRVRLHEMIVILGAPG